MRIPIRMGLIRCRRLVADLSEASRSIRCVAVDLSRPLGRGQFQFFPGPYILLIIFEVFTATTFTKCARRKHQFARQDQLDQQFSCSFIDRQKFFGLKARSKGKPAERFLLTVKRETHLWQAIVYVSVRIRQKLLSAGLSDKNFVANFTRFC